MKWVSHLDTYYNVQNIYFKIIWYINYCSRYELENWTHSIFFKIHHRMNGYRWWCLNQFFSPNILSNCPTKQCCRWVHNHLNDWRWSTTRINHIYLKICFKCQQFNTKWDSDNNNIFIVGFLFSALIFNTLEEIKNFFFIILMLQLCWIMTAQHDVVSPFLSIKMRRKINRN